MSAQANSQSGPGFAEAVKVWMKIGLLSFGGPAGQIALMHTELVERRRWLSERRFLHALNYCMMLPGPEAQQMAIYAGWLLHGVRGGLVAGALFVLPGALLMLGIAWAYMLYAEVPVVDAVFVGLKASVLAIVAASVLRIGGKILKNGVLWFIAGLSFFSLFVLGLPFPVVILSALVLGLAGGRWLPEWFRVAGGGHGAGAAGQGFAVDDAAGNLLGKPAVRRTLMTALLWTGVWLTPLLLCLVFLGRGHVLTEEGLFFSKAALVTFGGAYAVLPYVAQQAVEVHGWLTASEMMAGLGLAETTPGPLILVLQFVGFVGAWNAAEGVSPLLLATVASGLTVWAIFVPGYLFIFVGGPWMEHVRENERLQAGVTAVTAAVAGVILNLAIWFGWHVLVPEGEAVAWFSLLVSVVSFVLLVKLRWDVLRVVALGAGLGLLSLGF